jgi:hypothetical protein
MKRLHVRSIKEIRTGRKRDDSEEQPRADNHEAGLCSSAQKEERASDAKAPVPASHNAAAAGNYERS